MSARRQVRPDCRHLHLPSSPVTRKKHPRTIDSSGCNPFSQLRLSAAATPLQCGSAALFPIRPRRRSVGAVVENLIRRAVGLPQHLFARRTARVQDQEDVDQVHEWVDLWREKRDKRGAFTATGDLASISPGLAEDLWHMLTNEISWPTLLLTELAVEALLIVLFGVLCAVASGAGSYGEKIMLTLTTVRISSDSLFGWMPKPQSSAVEVLLLATCSWLHWLWLSVATAIIVYRALRPQRQIMFSPVCLIDEKASQVTIQLQLLRPNKVMLKDVQWQCMCMAGGSFVPLKLVTAGHPLMWFPGSYNVRHNIDEESPFHQTKLAELAAQNKVKSSYKSASLYLSFLLACR
jgi:hypothetical protein